jgi:hypothetical protein
MMLYGLKHVTIIKTNIFSIIKDSCIDCTTSDFFFTLEQAMKAHRESRGTALLVL